MAEDNLTAVLYKINDIRLEQRPIPVPKDDEVLLQMSCVGICGSDMHYWVHRRCSDFILKEPMIMGHEATGTVVKAGNHVSTFVTEVLLQMSCVGSCGSDIHYWVHGRCSDFILKEPMIMDHEASGTVVKVGNHVSTFVTVVLLEMSCVGICGSDLHYWVHGRCSNFILKEPMIMGREASGTVVKVGNHVSTFVTVVLLQMSCVGSCGSDIHYWVHVRCSNFILKEPMIMGREASGTVVKVGNHVSTFVTEVLLQMSCVGSCGSDIHYWVHGRCSDFIFKEPMIMDHEASGTVVKVGNHVSTFVTVVLLEMSCVGICGSDIHYWVHGRCSNFILKEPMIMGREASGTVVKVGNHVSTFVTVVLLEMSCVGICGSDIHYWVHGRCSNFILKEPMIMGREASGTVVKVGNHVSTFVTVVLLQMSCVGICGSDLHYWVHVRCSNFILKEPMIMGREASGTVVKVGNHVSTFVTEVLLQMSCVGSCGSDIHYWVHVRCSNFILKEPLIMGREASGTVVKVGNHVSTFVTVVLLQMSCVGSCGSDIHYWVHVRCSNFILKEPMIMGREASGTVVKVGNHVSTFVTVVLLQMSCVGICGSDIHYWVHGRCSDFILKEPMIMGREASGTVVKVGNHVSTFVTEVLLQMSCVGICGSDIHYWVHGRCSDFILKEPMIMGREASGTVVKVGNHVSTFVTEVLLQMSCVGSCGSDIHYWVHGRCSDFILKEPMIMDHEASGTVVKVGNHVSTFVTVVLLEMSCVGICGSDIHYWVHGRCSNFILKEPMIMGREASGTVVKVGNHVSTFVTEVLLQMSCVGICGSDLHYWVHVRCSDFILKEPMIMGHEASGTVVKAGNHASTFVTEVLLQMSCVGICCSDIHYWVHGQCSDFILKEPMIMGHEASGTVVKAGNHASTFVTEVLLQMSCVGICGSDIHYWVHGRCSDFILKEPMIMGREASGTVVKAGNHASTFVTEVLLQMSCVGICGSDIHYWVHGRCSDFILKEPMIMGHEASGTVVKVGNHVSTFVTEVLLQMSCVGICGSDIHYWVHGRCSDFILKEPMIMGHEASGTVVKAGNHASTFVTEVLLQMSCVGICGSDIHYWVHGRCSDFILKEPMIMGHEASGTVVKVGNHVSTFVTEVLLQMSCVGSCGSDLHYWVHVRCSNFILKEPMIMGREASGTVVKAGNHVSTFVTVVLLQMSCVGICGSDLHYWVHVRCSNFILKEPMIMGHEASGTVVKVGNHVSTFVTEVLLQMSCVGICGSDIHYWVHVRCSNFILKEPMIMGREASGTVVKVGNHVSTFVTEVLLQMSCVGSCGSDIHYWVHGRCSDFILKKPMIMGREASGTVVKVGNHASTFVTEVLLQMSCVGICGSDLHYWVHGRCSNFILKEPMIMGHEASGTVVKVGNHVSTFVTEVLLQMSCVGICGSDLHYWVHGRCSNFILKEPMIMGREASGTVVKVGNHASTFVTEVLLQMSCVGICGSDLHYWVHGRCSNFILKEPMIMGHEASGTVVKAGNHVSTFVTVVLLQMSCVGICGSDLHYWVHGRCSNFILKEPMIMGHEASGTVVKVGNHVSTFVTEVLLQMSCVGICGSDIHYWVHGRCSNFILKEPMIMGREASGTVVKVGNHVSTFVTEVLLQMSCVGICGSDIHYWVHGRCSDFILKEPMIMGHEASGTVVKAGKNVTHLKPGDRVAIEPGVPCRLCQYCKEGRYNLCLDMVFCATPPVHGNLSRYYTHAADFCFKIPDHVSLEEAALLEPLSVGVHACKRANITLGSTVLITGAGPIGLVTLLTAKAMGASKIIITDLVEHRLNVAKELGADYTLQVKIDENEKEISKKIVNLLGSCPKVTIDCSGFEATIRLAMEVTANGGMVVLVGMGSNEVKVNLTALAAREVDLRGVFRYANDYADALAMVESGKVNVKRLITHNFNIKETVKAFETAKSGIGNPIKVMIHCNKE